MVHLEQFANKIGRITPDGVLTEYTIPTAASGAFLITTGPDGALWFTESNPRGAQIGRITTAGEITEFPIPFTAPGDIIAGPDGALWFAAQVSNRIVRMTTSGELTSFPLPNPGSGPHGIAVGSDGALWFTQFTGNRIGRITTSGAITEFPVPSPGSTPSGIARGSDGAMWFGQRRGSRIGRITPEGAITEFPMSGSGTFGVGLGPDGAIWFAEESGGGRIGRISVSGLVSFFQPPTSNSLPFAVAAGPGGTVWFTENAGNKIGKIVLPASQPPAAVFESSPALPLVGQQVVFRDTSSSGPTSWSWDFGDGSTSTSQHPAHTYVAPGTYAVTLTVTNSLGSSVALRPVVVRGGIAGANCPTGAGTLCLNSLYSFTVALAARDQRTGRTGAGLPIPQNDLFGYFSIPALTDNPLNPEVFVKLLDGRTVNAKFWVFYAGLTDLEFALAVIDNASGASKIYFKEAGSACGGFDTNAF